MMNISITYGRSGPRRRDTQAAHQADAVPHLLRPGRPITIIIIIITIIITIIIIIIIIIIVMGPASREPGRRKGSDQQEGITEPTAMAVALDKRQQ